MLKEMKEAKKKVSSDFGFTTPAKYCIKVQGTIDESLSGYLSGMKITTKFKYGMKPISSLEGELKDQSALQGVFNALYEMHLSIVSLKTNDTD